MMATVARAVCVLRKVAIANSNLVTYSQLRSIKRWVAPTLHELQKRKQKYILAPQKRSEFLEWNYEAELYAFGKRFNEEFVDSLLKRALTHKSFVDLKENLTQIDNEHTNINYEELMGLGEEIILNCISREFSQKFPEEIVSSIKNYLMSETVLSKVVRHMGVIDLIKSADYPPNNEVLCDTFKAIIGALKESSSHERAGKFVKDFLLVQMVGKDVLDIWNLKDPLSYLQALLKDTNIEPRICNSSATGTILSNYQIGLYTNKKLLGTGFGETINTATNTAALDALQKIYCIQQ